MHHIVIALFFCFDRGTIYHPDSRLKRFLNNIIKLFIAYLDNLCSENLTDSETAVDYGESFPDGWYASEMVGHKVCQGEFTFS